MAQTDVSACGGCLSAPRSTTTAVETFYPSGNGFLGETTQEFLEDEVLDPIAQNSRTTAVLGTQEGTNIIASGGRDLSPLQRALAGPDDVLARLPGAHAEVTALDAAARAGLTPSEMAVSRAICPACQSAIEASGGQVGPGGLRAWWPW